ncbi:MAG: amino acid-binding protein [Frankiales bacterium]|nr:amino acid-binding protein [Frankiales bacterium]
MSRTRPLAKVVAALGAATLLLSACGGGDGDSGSAGGGAGSTTGIEGDTIKLGSHTPLTGVAAPGYSEISLGTKAYFDYVNANGGINGKKIEFTARDSAYNPAQASQVVNQLVLQDEVFGMIQGLGTPVHGAVVDFLNEEEVPDLFVSSGALAWDNPSEHPFTFGWQPNYEVEGKIVGKFIKENFPEAKVGLFLQGDDFGRDGAKGAKQFLADQVVAEVTYVPGNTVVGPQIDKLKASGADFVLGFNVPSYTALSQLAALKVNYKPKWFYSNVGSDATLVGGLLANFSKGAVKNGAGLLEGVYTTKYLPTVEDPANPWTKLFQKVWDAHGSSGELSNFKIYGMAGAYTFAEALAKAGDNVTRESLVESIENNGATFGGPQLAPFDYSKDSHRGISGLSVVQYTSGQVKELTKVQTTDGGDAPIEDYAGEPNTPDEDGIPNA